MSGFWDTVSSGASSVWNAASEYAAPAAHMIEGGMHIAAHGMKAAPLLGTVIGLVQGVGHGIQAAMAPEGSDERYDHIGAATLGALGAIPLVGTYLGAAELGWNGGAALATGGIGNAEHAGGNASQMVGGLIHAAASDTYDVGNITDRRDHFWANQAAGGGEHH